MLSSSDSILDQWYRNRVFFAAFWSWFIAQTIKVVLGILREKRFNFKWFVGSGGMPSSHVALTCGLATAVGLFYGFDSGSFAIAFAIMVITMFDAQGVRRQSGKQAGMLNKILDDLYAHRDIEPDRLKELFGHSPKEVFAGGLVGIAVASLFYIW